MLGKVSIIVEAAMAQFESDMGRAARVSEKEFKKMQRDGERAMRELRSEAVAAGKVLGTALAAGFIATGVAIRNMVKDAEQIRRLSELSGLGAEQFQKLAAGARTVGIENDKLADIYKDMQDRVGDFIQTGGGPLADFFEQIAPKIGVSIEQFRKLSGPDALQLFVDSLEKANLSQSEMTFYMEQIASDSSMLLPLLRDNGEGFRYWGEEAQKAGAIMSGETLDATRDLQIEMERVRLSVDGMWRQALPGLIPKLKELAQMINSPDFREGFQTLINGAVGAIGALAKFAVTTANVTKFLAESAAAAVNGPSADDIVRIEGRIARIKRAMDALREGGYNPIQMSGELAGIGLPSGKALELNYDLALGNTGSIIASLNGELAKEKNKLQFGMKLADDAAAQAAKLAEEAAKAITVNAPTVAFGSTGALASADGKREAADAVKALSDAELDLIAIEQVWAQGSIDASNRAAEAWANQGETVKQVASEMSLYAEQAGRNMQDAFAEFLFDPLDGGFKGMLESFADTLRKMAAQAAAAKIFESLGNTGNANSGTWWGAALSSLFGGGRANGGGVSGSKIYEVTEGGRPELLEQNGRTYLLPGSDGTVIPAGSMGGGGMAAAATAVNLKVEIINKGEGMKVERQETSTGPDGQKVLRVMVRNMVKGDMAGGEFDGVMGQAFGVRRQGQVNG